MSLIEYFEQNQGVGVLSTADAEGRVNAAIYSRPHIMDDGTLAFIMPDRLTHRNLNSNPYAAYLFRENGPGYKGKRIYLTKVREEKDTELIRSLRRKIYPPEVEEKGGPRSIVFFTVDKVLPLVGTGEYDPV
ncbi:MAG TPA: pyridoxamine 5'-phosphate oxidase family protein [Syntrophobacteraceae bacterium]|nr:pyridoxamine 5'-phosphate oxidase family protein [Syntrophobacteraceae bacterium]